MENNVLILSLNPGYGKIFFSPCSAYNTNLLNFIILIQLQLINTYNDIAEILLKVALNAITLTALNADIGSMKEHIRIMHIHFLEINPQKWGGGGGGSETKMHGKIYIVY